MSGTKSAWSQLLFAASVCAAAMLPSESQSQTGATVFEGARLITGESGSPIENSAFVAENGRITAVGRRGAPREST
jgi:capsular polysaccharide biosynthesis protein